MADAASPSPQRHLDTADEFQSSSPTTNAQRRGRPPFQETFQGKPREAAPDQGAVVPPRDVPARAPGRQNVPGEVPLLSLAPTQSRGTFRRGRPGPAPARPPPLTARSRRSPGPTKPEEDVSLLEATNRIAVLPTRVSSTRCDELTSS
ncbi:hypothetical protein MRX96_018424 [Rhipicephalus microplus]